MTSELDFFLLSFSHVYISRDLAYLQRQELRAKRAASQHAQPSELLVTQRQTLQTNRTPSKPSLWITLIVWGLRPVHMVVG